MCEQPNGAPTAPQGHRFDRRSLKFGLNGRRMRAKPWSGRAPPGEVSDLDMVALVSKTSLNPSLRSASLCPTGRVPTCDPLWRSGFKIPGDAVVCIARRPAGVLTGREASRVITFAC